jgi:predicted O-linked N-acetylglucosamine transferase (SPINDLY family)
MQVVADSEELFLRDMQHRGIPSNRFKVLKRMPEPQYLAAHASVDLILDTFPFCGLTVSMNALWMGVPSITLPENTSASRAGASLLKRMGLEEFIAHSEQEYVQIARNCAENPTRLSDIRLGLREKMRVAWADATAHTRELEKAFREMWKLHSGEIPCAPSEELPAANGRNTSEEKPGNFDTPFSERKITTSRPAPSEKKATTSNVETGIKRAVKPVDNNSERLATEIRECVALQLHDPTEKISEISTFLKGLQDPRKELLRAETLLAALPDAWKHYGICSELWKNSGFIEESDRCMERAQAFEPSAANWSWLARSQMRAERFDEAKRSFTAACEFPDVTADATLGLAYLLGTEGEYEAAEKLCRRTIGLSPSVWGAYLNLANLLYQRGEFQDALSIAEPAIRISDDPKLLLNLAVYQEKCGKYFDSLKSLEKVLEADPNSAAAFLNLGNALLFLGMPQEAVKAYRKTQLLDPSSHHTSSNFLHTFNYVPDTDPGEFYELHREFSRRFETPLLSQHRPHSNSKDPHRKLRIAYISPDLRGHSVAFFIKALLKHHDRSQFEVVGILSHTWKDGKTEELKGLCDQWIEAGKLSDEALAELIREEKIDIAVDLICHSQGSRALTFARKPAPIQVTMIGMQQTTGLESMDFRVTDAFMDPPGFTEHFHSEALIRLPYALCFYPPESAPPISRLPASKNGHITFGSFNNFAKAHRDVLDTWASVLHQVPNSRLFAVAPEGTALESTMAEKGISPDRITVTPRMSNNAYLLSHERVDFALDCFPFAGLTVSAIAAWMGVPTLTISGAIPSARAGADLMHSLGLDEFIASDPDDFVKKAASLAADLPKLEGIRSSMRERMSREVTNAPAYMRHFEGALRRAWGRWCRGETVKTPIP